MFQSSTKFKDHPLYAGVRRETQRWQQRQVEPVLSSTEPGEDEVTAPHFTAPPGVVITQHTRLHESNVENHFWVESQGKTNEREGGGRKRTNTGVITAQIKLKDDISSP